MKSNYWTAGVLVLALAFVTSCAGTTAPTSISTSASPSAPNAAPAPSITPATTIPSTAPIPPPRKVIPAKQWHQGKLEYGVQVYWHSIKPDTAHDNSDEIFDYAVGLGANSVGLTFPIYTDGATPTKVYVGPETPLPAEVSALVAKAKLRGLRVMLRPTIDEANIMTTRNQWRGSIRPVNTKAWFDSYQGVLMPFVKAAENSGANEVVLGTELFSLQSQSEYWKSLLMASQHIYHGTLSYDFNWNSISAGNLPFAVYGIDLYPKIDLSDGASLKQLTEALTLFMLQAPAKVLRNAAIHEVGIPGISGMYPHPWQWGTTTTKLNFGVQTKWFAAACNAVKKAGVNGLYYWMIDSNVNPLTVAPNSLPAFSFIGRPAEQSIRTCFAQ